MEKLADILSTENPILAGFRERIDRINAEIKANRDRLQSLYGDLTDSEILLALNTEKDLAQCEGCQGLPCSKKSDKGWRPTLEKHGGVLYQTFSECEYTKVRRRQTRLARRLSNAKIPSRCVGKTFDDYEVDADNKTAVRYAKTALTSGLGAFFYGERGTGKTLLAAIIAQEFLKAGKTVIFVKVPALLDEFRKTYRDSSQITEADLLKDIYTADLLILDDFGMEKTTQFAGAMLCKIIDARYDAGAQTIITSNYPLEDIQSRLDNATDGANYNGSRIVDRCREFCKPILFKGKSRRR